jgi:hypothetical protein
MGPLGHSCYHEQLTLGVTLPITCPSKALDRPFEPRKSKGLLFMTLSRGWFLPAGGRRSYLEDLEFVEVSTIVYGQTRSAHIQVMFKQSKLGA